MQILFPNCNLAFCKEYLPYNIFLILYKVINLFVCVYEIWALWYSHINSFQEVLELIKKLVTDFSWERIILKFCAQDKFIIENKIAKFFFPSITHPGPLFMYFYLPCLLGRTKVRVALILATILRLGFSKVTFDFCYFV